MAQNKQSSIIPHTHTGGVFESYPVPVDTQKQNRPRRTWRQALQESAPLVLPVAHDALSARLIELAGYPCRRARTYGHRWRDIYAPSGRRGR